MKKGSVKGKGSVKKDVSALHILKEQYTKDKLFDNADHVTDFDFDSKVAKVFDDMLIRSVPFYIEVQRMFVELAAHFVQKDTCVYDLGCSTGTTIISLMKLLKDRSIKFVAVDKSKPMLDKTKKNVYSLGDKKRLKLVERDLNDGINVEDASVVMINWTLQFVRPLYRDTLMKQIYNGLVKDGIVIISEKTLVRPSLLNRLYIDFYYNFKRRNGYSNMEIAQKREALENVLIPYRIEENVELLERNGFKCVDVFFRWYNFACFVGIKTKGEK